MGTARTGKGSTDGADDAGGHASTKIVGAACANAEGARTDAGGARNVLVSMGGQGAVLVAENGQVYTADAPKGQVVNAVGAGDSMVAGFLAGWLESGDYEHAFKMSVAAGSASAFSDQLATREEILALLKTM